MPAKQMMRELQVRLLEEYHEEPVHVKPSDEQETRTYFRVGFEDEEEKRNYFGGGFEDEQAPENSQRQM